MTQERLFTIDEARALMPEVVRRASSLVTVRADLAELGRALRAGVESPLGGVPELKGFEAQLDEILGWFRQEEIEVKGLAPFLIDFPAELDGHSVRLCWLETETDLGWYHLSELGFVGRRPL